MRQTREILRQRWELRRTQREVGQSLGISPSSVWEVVHRAKRGGLVWEEVRSLTEDALEERIYGPKIDKTSRAKPDCAALHTERRKPGVTLELLHLEYLEKNPNGYRYSQFCEIYRRWCKRRRLSMRQVHRAGEKGFFDYSGKKPHYTDQKTGEQIEVELFVAVLGASNYTFAEATLTQKVHDWIGSHVRAFAYFGGVPSLLVPDQLKSGVTKACRYEPEIQRTYEEMAEHYNTVVLPARPAHPRDKAKVEVGVQIAQRWILARMRNQKFFSLDELNERIGELLEELNARTMRIYRASRRDLFEKLDRPALKPLASDRFVCGEWKHAGVNIDYHIEVDGHYYSVHHGLVHERVEARITASTVEVFHKGQRHTSHARSYERGRFTTLTEHMPRSHRENAQWTPSRILHWAKTLGPQTEALAQAILAERPHPEQGFRSCLGIFRLGKRYGNDRLEAASGRALQIGARTYRHVESILKHGLDRVALTPSTETEKPPIDHENIRGRDYYN